MCFDKICHTTFKSLILKHCYVCDRCKSQLISRFITFEIHGCKGISIYEYDEKLRNLIYQYKGCYDYELKNVFLEGYSGVLRSIFKNYIVIPVPSHKIENEKRGFNHVEEICKVFSNRVISCVDKIENVKQSSLKSFERCNICKNLKLSNIEQIKNKSILIVDDILTTGSTMASMIDLIKGCGPSKIKILVLAKVNQFEINNL